MRRFLKAALLVPMAALVTSAAPAPPPRTPTLGPTPTLITKPVWAREPTAVEFSCGFPAQYERAGGRRGAAVVRCKATAEGALAACRVTNEQPADVGVGEAALRMTKGYRLAPVDGDGRPTAGRLILLAVPITYDPAHAVTTSLVCREFADIYQ